MSKVSNTPTKVAVAVLALIALPTVIAAVLFSYWWVTDEKFRTGRG